MKLSYIVANDMSSVVTLHMSAMPAYIFLKVHHDEYRTSNSHMRRSVCVPVSKMSLAIKCLWSVYLKSKINNAVVSVVVSCLIKTHIFKTSTQKMQCTHF